MTRTGKRGSGQKSVPATSPAPAGPAHGARMWLARRPFQRFVLVFLALCLGGLYAIGATPWVQRTFFPWYLETNAAVSARVLDVLGEDASNTGTVLATPRFQVDIRRGCDTIAPSIIFGAALLAFPAPWRRKLAGLVAGVALLAVLNVFRIVTLYYTGVHFPNAFQAMHLDVWQPVFIVLALLMWIIWAMWASPVRAAESNGKGPDHQRPTGPRSGARRPAPKPSSG